MPFLLCLKKKKSPVPLGRSIFQKHTPPIQQNYQALLESCLKSKRLFTDDTFPAHISSIGTGALLKKLPRNLQWKRPHALHKSPVFYAANRKQLDLCQGLVENCWFLAALEALTFHQDILAAVVPQNQSFERKYAGIFHFRVQLLPQIAGDPQISSALLCVTPVDNLYVVPLGQGQVAREFPSLERSPSPLPQSSAGSESTASHSEDTPLLGCSLQLCPTHI